MTTLELYDKADGAVFSPCRSYRYVLWRGIAQLMRKPGCLSTCNFIMLNPSTADEVKADPTVTRCLGFAEGWGFERLVVTNLFAWRSTDPHEMKTKVDPVGPQNDDHIIDCAQHADLVVCAWGNDGAHRSRAQHVVRLLRANRVRPRALKFNGNTGQPTHPLYLKKDLTPVELPA